MKTSSNEVIERNICAQLKERIKNESYKLLYQTIYNELE